MGSSLVLTGGAATAKTLKEAISLTSHGFTVGDVLRFNPSGVPKSYVKAQANSAENAEVLGIVNSVSDVNTFELTYGGYIDLPQFSGVSFPVMFLSGVCAGGLTSSPPSAVGTVVKPVVTRHPLLNGFVMNNYLGTQIGGSSTIAVEEIQPVGTIMPFAGNAIPDTWLRCDGASYGIGSYTELYSKLCYTTGDRAPIYGYVAKITATGWSTAVGSYIQFKNNTTNWTTNQPATGQNLIYDTQAEITAQIIAISGQDAIVQVLPNYSSGRLTYPNMVFTLTPSDFVSFLYNNASAFGARYRLLDSTGKIIHTNNNVSAVSIVAFNTPDLRGRFALGVNPSAIGELEGDATNISAISSVYPLGSEGGEEKHTLTTSEMPSHSHDYSTTDPYPATGYSGFNKLTRRTEVNEVRTAATVDATVSGDQLDILSSATLVIGSTGANASHNNMPPYVALQYIIKAKPYTRAAIIDGVDLPYSNLLVRSTDSNSLRSELLSGASGGDLVFYTNSGEASKTGTERMRLTNRNGLRLTQQDGYTFGINIIGSGANPGSTSVSSVASFLKFYNPETPINPYTWWCPRDGVALSVESHSTNEGTIIDQYSTGGLGTPLFTVTSVGNVGIGNSSPGATLDVNGTLKVGNFGSATNVMAKPTNTNLTVGQVVPIIRGSLIWNGGVYYAWQSVTALPAGTWFVYMTAADNSSITGVGAVDEDTHFCMAKVWTVPTGNFLRFGNLVKIPTSTDTSICYWLDSTDALKTYSNYTTNLNEFKIGGVGDSAVVNSEGNNYPITSAGTGPSVFYTPSSADNPYGLSNWVGYAIRIA